MGVAKEPCSEYQNFQKIWAHDIDPNVPFERFSVPFDMSWTYIMVEEGLFFNFPQKHEIRKWTSDSHSTFWYGVYLNAEFIFSESFDIWWMVFKLHPYLIIWLLDLLSTC